MELCQNTSPAHWRFHPQPEPPLELTQSRDRVGVWEFPTAQLGSNPLLASPSCCHQRAWPQLWVSAQGPSLCCAPCPELGQELLHSSRAALGLSSPWTMWRSSSIPGPSIKHSPQTLSSSIPAFIPCSSRHCLPALEQRDYPSHPQTHLQGDQAPFSSHFSPLGTPGRFLPTTGINISLISVPQQKGSV